jgi:hypothetical protein
MCGAGLLTIVAACASLRSDPTDDSARPASDVPGQFDGTTPAPGCRSPLTDPRDGTVLRLVRSTEDRGDYDVPAGRYGVLPGELLRVDCANGAVIGIVRR